MNRAGVEGLGLSFLILLFLGAVGAGISFYAYSSYSSLETVRSFYQAIGDTREKITWLRYNNDKGAFTSVALKVPKGYNVSFEYSYIRIRNDTDSFSIPLDVNFTKPLSLSSGTYTLRLCYGFCENRKYLIIFE